MTKHFEKLMPLIVPEGWSFQHFTDGTLPKLIQALPWILKENILVLLERPRDKIIHSMLKHLQITNNIVWYSRGTVYGAKEMYFACKTPPVHPDLWQKARQLFVDSVISVPGPVVQDKIILLKRTRHNSANGGRMINNWGSIVSLYAKKYGDKLIEYDASEHNFESTVRLFSSARWIVGSHGGAIFNQLFAPKHTNIVEYMPVHADGSLYLRHGGLMSYVFSVMLNQRHWRISEISRDGNINLLEQLPEEYNYKKT